MWKFEEWGGFIPLGIVLALVLFVLFAGTLNGLFGL